MKTTLTRQIKASLFSYFSLNGYLVPQAQAEQEIREGVSFRGINILILITAIFIASLGLNTNSTAVIIGAMLISPLMGPIVGMGLGVGICDFALIKRSLRNLGMATVFSVLTSTLYFLISPVSEGHSELLARTSPTIYDVLIAFFGGAAGILAAGSRYKGNVIPGVAIATALMPPLCTAGYGLGTWQLNYFFGAFYLFLINSVYIALASFIGVKLMKYKMVDQANVPRAGKVRKLVYAIALLVMLPSVYLTWSMLRQSDFQQRASRFIAAEFRFPQTQVVNEHAFVDGGKRVIQVTLIGKILPADSLRMALEPRLRAFGLEGASLDIIQGDMPQSVDAATSLKDFYQLAQATIARQHNTIDSLNRAAASRLAADTISAAIAPELKVLFPQVADLAVSQAIFGVVETGALDTANVVMVRYNRRMSPAELTKFREYLRARLRLKNLSLVDVGDAIALQSQTSNPKPPAGK